MRAPSSRLFGGRQPLTSTCAAGFEGRSGTDLFDLTGKVALVTGSSMGLGAGMAAGLAQAGAHVIINSRKADACAAVAEKIQSMGCKATAMAFDVTDEKSVVKAVKKIVKQLGTIDILVNNAGSTRRSPFLESSTVRTGRPAPLRSWRLALTTSNRRRAQEDLDFVVKLNLNGPYICAREVGKVMKEAGGGKIINISSLMSVLGRATIQPYNATKFAINGLTRGLACELGPYGIQVNGIGPGYFVTDLTQELLDRPDFNKFVRTRTPAGYWGVPEDLQGAVIFLASPASNYVSGHNLMVDGGMSVSCGAPHFAARTNSSALACTLTFVHSVLRSNGSARACSLF